MVSPNHCEVRAARDPQVLAVELSQCRAHLADVVKAAADWLANWDDPKSPFDRAAIMGDPGNRRISMRFERQEDWSNLAHEARADQRLF